MKIGFGKLWLRGIIESSENGLRPVIVSSRGELVKSLALGLTATLLFSIGLYICISAILIAFLTLIL